MKTIWLVALIAACLARATNAAVGIDANPAVDPIERMMADPKLPITRQTLGFCRTKLSPEKSVAFAEYLRAKWVRQLLTTPSYVGTDIDTEAKESLANLNQCLEGIKTPETAKTIDACMSRMKGLFGEMSSSMAVAKNNPATQMPDWLKKDPELQKLLLNLNDVEKARSYIKEKINAKRPDDKKVLTFLFKPTIQVGGEFDSLRLMVIDPDDKGIVKWGLIEYRGSVASEQAKGQLGSYAVFSYDPKSKTYYAADHTRADQGGRTSFHYEGARKTCTQCHKSGPMAVLEDTLVNPAHKDDWKKSFKLRSGELKAPKEGGGFFDMSKFGPSMGEYMDPEKTEKNRGEAFFRKCLNTFDEGKRYLKRINDTKGTTYAETVATEFTTFRRKVAGHMNCASCHTGQEDYAALGYGSAGHLNYPLAAFPSKEDLVRTRVEHGSMPRGTTKDSLNQLQRLTLANCLAYEQYGRPVSEGGLAINPEAVENSKFNKWLTGVSCKDGKDPDAPAATSDPGNGIKKPGQR